jgi:hypothetical protein
MKRIVIYHANCVDGWVAAWAAWRLYGDADTEYVPLHGDVTAVQANYRATGRLTDERDLPATPRVTR